ncbi:protein PHYLLO, chloroplastic isoform X1 [Salvia hispanica]|uniref:protein PHYLLO, chloroplastic isoform X1 n=2 Tax=Salvia hispanica TaxID=49212 RepID=UPI00200998C4|nr:protein PHYLLO, chloroplastic isoform X1 [Salvia hispanica]
MDYRIVNSQITLQFPPTKLQLHQNTIIKINKRTHFLKPAFPRFIRFNNRQNPISKVVRSSMGKDRVLDDKEAALLVNSCITRNLAPVLSLDQGLDAIKAAVEELKANPPTCSSGMYRFQLAVPPSAKALNWFCSQPESSKVFPLFFLSSDKENPTYESLSLGRTRGVFGIGSAVSFKGSPHASGKHSYLSRYLPAELTSSKAYGFLDIELDTKMSTVERQTGSYYVFIPQIELDEFEDISFLSATLAWDDSSMCTFSEAVQTFESSFQQARYTSASGSQLICSSLLKFKNAEKHTQMVRVNSLLMDGKKLEASTLELEDASSCFSQFSARLSPTLSIANNMHSEHETNKVNFFCHDSPNINALWASLIVEECTRLGLTYFCIAPGSRSSPLTIAAASHPLTTCIACIDERSLAFHALGYAKGSQKPAVVITSSGTAVSNLFPAVVEASQSFVPMLLLTADRPPELVDVGANQAINQVNHFGTFARQFFSLPPPTDEISARLVLTTIDSAVHKATSSPNGPIHINCPFREPLANSLKDWNRKCVDGLDFWMSNAEPFTRYIPPQKSLSCSDMYSHMNEVLELIEGANDGVLVFGSIHKEDDMWGALLLAKHLLWPVVIDIQSGLRLRKYLSSFLDRKDILFVDQLDQLLQSDSVRAWMKADVIVQIGSRITGRRISQMINQSCPSSLILVDDHPGRHDPSHIITHRIQSTISQFSDSVIKSCKPNIRKRWKDFLRGLDMMVASESSSFITSEKSLTEPYVARKIFETLRCGSALFFGNSMTIRDADMYGSNWVQCTHPASLMLSAGLPCHWVHVTANRGASGIDGLISSAVGFAVGCNKRVLLVMGDVSFLHDTNGLALLRHRTSRKPMVIVVVNNRGGAIFSQLPVASTIDRNIMDQFFYTSHNVSIRHLCLAHGVKHVQVQTKTELQNALFTSQREDVDCIVEVESEIETNITFHNNLRTFTRQASDHAYNVLSKLSIADSTSPGPIDCKVSKMDYSQYRVQLNAPPTSSSGNSNNFPSYREGFVIILSLDDGSVGFGEVAPLEIHKENLLDVEEQLRFLMHVIEGNTVSDNLPLLKGSFSSWIWNNLGIPPGSIFPSVRCGLEMAILSAIASRHGCSILDVLHPSAGELSKRSSPVQICALIDSYGSPMDTAFIASTLVAEGFTTIKIKVARREDPDEDIAAIKEVRRKVGENIVLRVDANRKWTYDAAVKFAHGVKECCLQYIEEPVDNEDDIMKFCEQTGLPVALDETINSVTENPLLVLQKYSHSGVAAVVIKPGVIGGFENAALVARWAQQHGKMTVISAAFESALGLSAYIQFACYLDVQNAEMQSLMKKEQPQSSTAHGFGTYKWFKEQVTTEPLDIHHNPQHGSVEADAADAGRFLQKCRLNPEAVVRTSDEKEVKEYQIAVDTEGVSFSINVLETGESNDGSAVVFLHGFLGTSVDWIPIMKAISSSTRSIAIDLPGHGGSKLQYHGENDSDKPNLSIDVMAEVLHKVLKTLTHGKVTLVGYSMGARISLYTALKCSDKIERAMIISGSPGLIDNDARTTRKAKDDFRASTLVANGLEFFLDTWYAEELWTSLRSHPHFKQTVTKRLKHQDLHTLGKVLSDLSIGRQPSMWEDLKQCKVPLQLIVGEKDAKFKAIAIEMQERIVPENSFPLVVEIPSAGHAVHVENPLAVITAITQFVKTVKTT